MGGMGLGDDAMGDDLDDSDDEGNEFHGISLAWIDSVCFHAQ